MTNIIDALVNIIENKNLTIKDIYSGNNKINNVGDALEDYVKRAFSNSINLDESSTSEKFFETFSYLGNAKNPPDAMLKNGPALEIKKSKQFKSEIALNSSYPKRMLNINDTKITKKCKQCNDWSSEYRDIIYILGEVDKEQLKELLFIYGKDYAAPSKCYESVINAVETKISELEGLNLGTSKELGRINSLDPLEITNLRIRGMWTIKHPLKIYKCVEEFLPKNYTFRLIAIINDKIWKSFNNTNKLIELSYANKNLNIVDFSAPSPTIKSHNTELKLIYYYEE